MSRQNMFYWQADRPYSVEEIKTIFLARKDDYSKEELAAAVSRAMKESVTIHDPINHGSVNIVCPFTSHSGKEGVIRAHPRQVKNEYFYSESEVMKVAKNAGVPVPSTILVDDSRSIVPFDYMITSKIAGQVMKEVTKNNPTIQREYLAQIGEYLGKLHQVKTKGYGFFDNNLAKQGELSGIHKSNQEHFLSALDADEQFHKSYPQHLDPNLVSSALAYLKDNLSLTRCDSPTIVHNDIADWNTIVQGSFVTGIMDWDECFSGDPVFDFATASLFYDDSQMECLVNGYLKSNNLPANYQEKYNLYTARYILSKSKIAIKQLNSRQNDFMKLWLENASAKLKSIIEKV